MKSATLAILGLAAVAAAQSSGGTLLDAVPECAHKCLSEAIQNGTPCKVDDGECLCIPDNYYSIYDVGQACVLLECGAALAIEEVLPQAQQFCADITGLSAEVTGTELVTALPTKTPAPSSASGPASNNTASAGSPSSTADGAAATSSDEPDAAPVVARLGTLGLLALGALAAF